MPFANRIKVPGYARASMHILAALFVDNISPRAVPGPATHLDIDGVQFSAPAPTEPPFTWAPHLAVIVHAPEDSDGAGVLEVGFFHNSARVARNVQPLQIEPGKFSFRLVRAEIDLTAIGTVEAHCRTSPTAEPVIVPFTLLAPVSQPGAGADAS